MKKNLEVIGVGRKADGSEYWILEGNFELPVDSKNYTEMLDSLIANEKRYVEVLAEVNREEKK